MPSFFLIDFRGAAPAFWRVQLAPYLQSQRNYNTIEIYGNLVGLAFTSGEGGASLVVFCIPITHLPCFQSASFGLSCLCAPSFNCILAAARHGAFLKWLNPSKSTSHTASNFTSQRRVQDQFSNPRECSIMN